MRVSKISAFEKWGYGLAAIGLLLVFATFPASKKDVVFATTQGGPIVLDGMDPVCHAAMGENTDQYIAKVLKSVYDQSTIPGNNGKIAILGIANPNNAGGCGNSDNNWNILLSTKFLAQFPIAPQVEFITTAAELTTFFDTTITSAPPRVLWIPDDWSRSSEVSNVFVSKAENIADFVNSGGGLFSSVNNYGWLTALLPQAVFNNGGCNGGPEATSDGVTDFGLSNTIVKACWHGYFTGNVGTLKTLVDYPYDAIDPWTITPSTPRVAVSIGGGEVSLPSSFTLGISPSTPEAGQDLTITAVAQTLAGVPQSGVVVTVNVSSGPDSGQTFTATTDSTGTASITVRTNSVGTAVYTATAVVNGVSKTVSVTVAWEPPATTVAPSTTEPTPTTTEPTPTTTEPVITTTEPPVVQQPETTTQPPLTIAPVTTVHDHSTHSHGVIDWLPQSGGRTNMPMILGFLLIIGGFALSIFPLIKRNHK
jgi:hypothetical protein